MKSSSKLERKLMMTLPKILKEAVAITKESPKAFSLITLAFIFPLSFAIFANSVFTDSIIVKLADEKSGSHSSASEWGRLLALQFCSFIFLLPFWVLSISSVAFTVASHYSSKAVSFRSTISAAPMLMRLFVTLLWASPFMAVSNVVLYAVMEHVYEAAETQNMVLYALNVYAVIVIYSVVLVYFTTLWHLACVVSVLEPLYGFAAVMKSIELLKGMSGMGAKIAFFHWGMYGNIKVFFVGIVVYRAFGNGLFGRVLVGGVLVCVFAVLNLVGLLVECVYYHDCQSYHHHKSALHDHPGSYLGKNVPLKSSVQTENLDA